MLNTAYIIQNFSENLSKITTIDELIKLAKAQKFCLKVDFIHKIPRILTWDLTNDSFSEEYNLLICPRIIIEEKTFAPPEMIASDIPLGMVDCQRVFLETLKQAIRCVQKI